MSDTKPLDPENTLYLDIKQGRVVIQLAARHRADACAADQDPGAPGLLRRHAVPPRHRGLHGAGRRSDRHRHRRQRPRQHPRRIHRQGQVRARHVRHGSHSQSPHSANSQFFIMFEPALAPERPIHRSGARSWRAWNSSIRSSAAPAAAARCGDPDRIVALRVAADVT